MALKVEATVPIFRIFSYEKAIEFYVGFLGFKVDWEARFSPDAPVYLQVSRDGIRLHLSEHHGDGTPGSMAYIYLNGVEELHKELNDKNYRHNRPGLEAQEWGMLECRVVDPFQNRIVFGQHHDHQKRMTPA